MWSRERGSRGDDWLRSEPAAAQASLLPRDRGALAPMDVPGSEEGSGAARLVSGEGMSVAPLEGAVRSYDWGSRTHLARLRGRAVPTDRPEAELWFGAHSTAPALLHRRGASVGLDRAIAADPVVELGEPCIARFGPRLPFLVKILAIERPLSVQLHPAADAAAEGFRDEERRGVALSDPERTFPDPWEKGEVLIALTRTRARADLRVPARIRSMVRALAPELLEVLPAARSDGASSPRAESLDLLLALITAPERLRRDAVSALRDRCDALLSRPEVGPVSDGTHDVRADAEAALTLLRTHDADPDVLAVLALEEFELEPGEAVSVPPGVLHSYQDGMAVEVMSASDCVIRFGLSSKVVRPRMGERHARPESSARRITTVRDREGWEVLAETRPEFWSAHAVLDGGSRGWPEDAPSLGPAIVLATAGSLEIGAGNDVVRIGAGEAAWVSASAPEPRFRGRAELRVVTSGPPDIAERGVPDAGR